MKRALGLASALVLLAVPARAGDGAGISLGYSFLQYLGEGGGNAPLGFYLSLAGRGATAIEIDLAYHRDKETAIAPGGSAVDATLNTFTALLGPRFGRGASRYGRSSGARPYFHLVGGLRYDRGTVLGVTDTQTSWGGMTGLGVDVKAGQGFSIRLAADFQIFFRSADDVLGKRTENLKTLRFSAGLTF